MFCFYQLKDTDNPDNPMTRYLTVSLTSSSEMEQREKKMSNILSSQVTQGLRCGHLQILSNLLVGLSQPSESP